MERKSTEIKLDTVEKQKTRFNTIYKIGAMATLIAAGLWLFNTKELSKSEAEIISNSEIPTNEDRISCEATWQMTGFGHDNGDWVEGGISKIDANGAPINAEKLLDDWIVKVGQDNSTLEYLTEVTAKFSENNNINIDPTTLVTIDGCATDLAVKDIAYVREQFAKTRISYGLAPVDGKSSYVNEHNEIEFGEMPKNRESIVIDFGGGKFLYVLLDCGNLVTYEVVNNVVIHKTVIIVENTIIKKTTNSNHSHNRHQHERTSRKNNDDPSTRGRSDTGSGQNTDRSAGDYQSQSDVAKPK